MHDEKTGDSLNESILTMTTERAARECWTRHDMDPAVLPSLLVSYRSPDTSAVILKVLRVPSTSRAAETRMAPSMLRASAGIGTNG